MKRLGIRLESILYLLALGLALFIRLAVVGRLPLANGEATLALQALDLSRGQAVTIDPQPAYLAFTTLLMFILGPLDWVARFWPAVVGSLIVLAPALFKKRIGHLPALLLAFFFAIDPLLLGVSRHAGGLPLALTFVLLSTGLLARLTPGEGRPALAGVCLGLGLLSGPDFWSGLLGLGLALLLARLLFGGRIMGNKAVSAGEERTPGPSPARTALFFALGTVFFLGTLFLAIPGGLSAMAGGLTGYLSGWARASGISPGMMLLGLISYSFFPLGFGIWGAVNGLLRRRVVDAFLLFWWLAALVLALVYPSRQVADLTWSIVPLWALAARQIAHLVSLPSGERLPVIGQALLAAVILGFASMTLVSMSDMQQAADAVKQQYVLRLAGAAIMLVAGGGLIAWGWSRTVAERGITWGLGVILFLYLLASGWNAAGLSSRNGLEIWNNDPLPSGMGLLRQTISDLKEWNDMRLGALDLVVVDEDSAALRWALRGQQKISYLPQVPTGSTPALVITANQPDLGLAASYRGQAFTLEEKANFIPTSPAGWLRWLVFRTVPADRVTREPVILWARTDLFAGGELQTTPPEQAAPADGK
jgi:hypothetical protein